MDHVLPALQVKPVSSAVVEDHPSGFEDRVGQSRRLAWRQLKKALSLKTKVVPIEVIKIDRLRGHGHRQSHTACGMNGLALKASAIHLCSLKAHTAVSNQLSAGRRVALPI
ncbi:MAG: hypothetical protein ACYCW6_25815, partial [Candidatus Xenobia bacterium]